MERAARCRRILLLLRLELVYVVALTTRHVIEHDADIFERRMPPEMPSVTTGAVLALQGQVFHRPLGRMGLMAVLAGHAGVVMRTAGPCKAFEFAESLGVASHTRCVLLWNIVRTSEGEQRWVARTSPGPGGM